MIICHDEFPLWFVKYIRLLVPAFIYRFWTTVNVGSSAYSSPLLDIGLPNRTPSDSILGYSHPVLTKLWTGPDRTVVGSRSMYNTGILIRVSFQSNLHPVRLEAVPGILGKKLDDDDDAGKGTEGTLLNKT